MNRQFRLALFWVSIILLLSAGVIAAEMVNGKAKEDQKLLDEAKYIISITPKGSLSAYYVNGREWDINDLVIQIKSIVESDDEIKIIVAYDSRNDLAYKNLEQRFIDAGLDGGSVVYVPVPYSYLRKISGLPDKDDEEEHYGAAATIDEITDDRMMVMVEEAMALIPREINSKTYSDVISRIKDFLDKYKEYRKTNIYKSHEKTYKRLLKNKNLYIPPDGGAKVPDGEKKAEEADSPTTLRWAPDLRLGVS